MQLMLLLICTDTKVNVAVYVYKYCFVRWYTVMLQDEWPSFFICNALFLEISITE